MTTVLVKKGPLYTIGEEIGNAISHGVGGLLGIAGLVLLLIRAQNALQVVSFAIYGASMIVLFTMSALYHSITNVRAKHILRIFDHGTIFLLIAGTYTPFTLVTLQGAWGWTIFGIVWGVAIIGMVFNFINMERFKKICMVGYLVSGWCIVFAMAALIRAMALPGLLLLLLGGVFYTGGLIFYGQKAPYRHFIWHFFVLAGAIAHFFCVYLYVV